MTNLDPLQLLDSFGEDISKEASRNALQCLTFLELRLSPYMSPTKACEDGGTCLCVWERTHADFLCITMDSCDPYFHPYQITGGGQVHMLM